MKKKTLPHLLYLGKWSSFIIRIPRGRVLVYYEGAANPLFEWEHPEPAKIFSPVYYYYNSEKGHTIGVAFDCASSMFCDLKSVFVILAFEIFDNLSTRRMSYREHANRSLH